MTRVLAVVLLAWLTLAASPAAAQEAALSGDVPTAGGIGLVVFGGGTVEELRAAASSRGCSATSVWVSSGGNLFGHITDAPPFVNREFTALFPDDIPSGTPMVLVCDAGTAPSPSLPGGVSLLFLDEDAIDNGLFYLLDPTLGVQNIFPDNPTEFTDREVNDDRASEGLRDLLPFFVARRGETVALLSGQTGDEGWFAPACIPQRWLAGESGDSCLTDSSQLQQAIRNFVGGTVPQDRLDEVPGVRPLRARGFDELIGTTVCAVVYDSDISVNYISSSPFQRANLQGATYGIIALTVLDVVRLTQFSSSSLPEVQVRIEDAAQNCGGSLELFEAPIPASSSEPEDVDPTQPVSGYMNR